MAASLSGADPSGANLSGANLSGANPIRIEPMSPAVGLWVGGVDLLALDGGLAAMIADMWQLGGALLFRGQDDPALAAAKLAAVLAKGPVAGGDADASGERVRIGGAWAMPGGNLALPPKALVLGGEAAAAPLAMAGMEAAADALRMEDPGFLAEIASARAAHAGGGPVHPVLHRHPLSGEPCLYPPPAALAHFPGGDRLLAHAERPAFCWTHEWQAGDVLAVDPRAVRCRWADGREHAAAMIVAPGAVPLADCRAPADEWE